MGRAEETIIARGASQASHLKGALVFSTEIDNGPEDLKGRKVYVSIDPDGIAELLSALAVMRSADEVWEYIATVRNRQGAFPVRGRPAFDTRENREGIAARLRAYLNGCPACGAVMYGRGPFDGTAYSTGVEHGHAGFGDTYLCHAGHWWALIQGGLIPPEHILTVVD